MSDKYLYRCPKCCVVLCDPNTQDVEAEYSDHRQLWVWCPVCKEWVEAHCIDTV